MSVDASRGLVVGCVDSDALTLVELVAFFRRRVLVEVDCS